MAELDPILEVVVAGSLPVTTEELRAHLRLPSGVGDESELERIIGAATRYAEKSLDRSLTSTTYKLTVPDAESVVVLPRGPVSSITEVRDGDSGTFLAYEQWGDRVILEDGKPTASSIEITYVAGGVSDDLKQGVLMHAAELWSRREATSESTRYGSRYGIDALYRTNDNSIKVA